jgi:hypothetical protein
MNRETDPNSEYLTEGWFGLRNRGQLEQGISNRERDQREEEFFKEQEWADLDQPRRLGIYWLRKALTKMLNAHIAKSIPTLIPEIRAKITDCKTELDRLGEARDTRSEQLNCMMTLATEFSKLSVDALNGNYHTLPAGPNAKVRKIYQDALDELQQNMHRDRKTFFISDPGYDIVLSEPESDFNPDSSYNLLQ